MSRPSLREHLRSQKSRVLDAIRGREGDAVDRGLEVYRELVDTFLSRLDDYGLTYDREDAQAESGFFTSIRGWRGIRWIRDDYVAFCEAAFEDPHKDVLLSVIYLPYSLAARALQSTDYYILHLFLFELGSYRYSLARRLDDSFLRSLVIERLGLHSKHFVKFQVSSLLKEVESPSSLQFVGEVVEGFILHFNTLLKASLENDEMDHFEEFDAVLTGIAQGIEWRLPGHDDWRAQMRYADEAEVRREWGEETHELQTTFAELSNELSDLKQVVRFGLASWVLRSFYRGGRSPSDTRQWLELCGPLGNIQNLLYIYALSLEIGSQDKLGWDRWVMEKVETDRVVTIDTSWSLHLVVIYYGADEIGGNGMVSPLPGDLERARIIYQQAQDGGGLRKTVRGLSEKADIWGRVWDRDVEVVREEYLEFLDSLVDRFEERWENEVADAELSGERVGHFGTAIEEGYRDDHSLIEIFNVAGRVEIEDELERNTAEGESGWYGYHQLMKKEMFVPQSNVHIDYLGNQYGERMAQSEDERILQALVDDVGGNGGDFENEDVVGLRQLIEKVRDGETDGLAVVIINCWDFYRSLELGDHLVYRRDRDVSQAVASAIAGFFDGVPVYRVRSTEVEGVLVADFGRLGTVRRYRPRIEDDVEDGRELEVVAECLKYGLSTFDEEEARQLLEEQDSVRKEGETDEDAVERLMRRVRFELYSRVEFDLEQAEAGVWHSCS